MNFIGKAYGRLTGLITGILMLPARAAGLIFSVPGRAYSLASSGVGKMRSSGGGAAKGPATAADSPTPSIEQRRGASGDPLPPIPEEVPATSLQTPTPLDHPTQL